MSEQLRKKLSDLNIDNQNVPDSFTTLTIVKTILGQILLEINDMKKHTNNDHQNMSSVPILWASVRSRGCQFLGPDMQDEILRLVLLAMQDGSYLSRKVLVMFVVKKIECRYPKLTSKTAIGHVVQLLYRASCFMVEKKNGESSLMQLRSHLRTYDQLRNAHDREIVQIAKEAGLSYISPELWSNLLFGDSNHQTYMMNILFQQNLTIFNHKSIETFFLDKISKSSIKYLLTDIEFVLQGKTGQLETCLLTVERILKQYLVAIHGLVTSSSDSNQNHERYKTSMCKDSMCSRSSLRAAQCHYAHDKQEIELPELEILHQSINAIRKRNYNEGNDEKTMMLNKPLSSPTNNNTQEIVPSKICSEMIRTDYQNFPIGHSLQDIVPTYPLQIIPFDTECTSIQQITSEDRDGALRLKSLLLTDTTSGTLAVPIPNIPIIRQVPLSSNLQPAIISDDRVTFISPQAQAAHIDAHRQNMAPVPLQRPINTDYRVQRNPLYCGDNIPKIHQQHHQHRQPPAHQLLRDVPRADPLACLRSTQAISKLLRPVAQTVMSQEEALAALVSPLHGLMHNPHIVPGAASACIVPSLLTTGYSMMPPMDRHLSPGALPTNIIPTMHVLTQNVPRLAHHRIVNQMERLNPCQSAVLSRPTLNSIQPHYEEAPYRITPQCSPTTKVSPEVSNVRNQTPSFTHEVSNADEANQNKKKRDALYSLTLNDVIDHSWDFNVSYNQKNRVLDSEYYSHMKDTEESVQCLKEQLYPIENIELNDKHTNLLENESVFKIYENSLVLPNQDIIEKVNTLFFQRNIIIEQIRHMHQNVKDREKVSSQVDEFIPFQRNVISKFGPISRSALISQSSTSIFTSTNFNNTVNEVNTVTPLKRPYSSSIKDFSIIENVNGTKSIYTENKSHINNRDKNKEFENKSLSNMYSLSSSLKLKANDKRECFISDKDREDSDNQYLLKALGSIENEIRNLTKT